MVGAGVQGVTLPDQGGQRALEHTPAHLQVAVVGWLVVVGGWCWRAGRHTPGPGRS